MGYRTEADWLATCHPVAAAAVRRAAGAGGGGSARVCGTNAGSAREQAAEAPQPTGGRGGSRGSCHRQWGGGQSYKEGPEVRN